jgi:hypothetical protein
MHSTLRFVLTAISVIVLTWPLLFWGKPTSSDHRTPLSHTETGLPELLW